jgi:3-deoxy-D-manno-octulosonate 8-phosphate phosphatase (KDO 8-P phosphatase)
MVTSLRLLSIEEARRRAARLRLVLTDCDGVLTDQGVYYSDHGELLKRFSIRDGMGVRRLREQGIETAIVTSERSASVLRRADKLEIAAFVGVSDKAAQLDGVLDELDAGLDEVAYIGDDTNDLGILDRVAALGLSAAPNDGMPPVLARVHHVTCAAGGHGAFREFAEWLLTLRAAARSHERPPKASTKRLTVAERGVTSPRTG